MEHDDRDGQEGALVLALNLATMMARAPCTECSGTPCQTTVQGHSSTTYYDWAWNFDMTGLLSRNFH